MNLAPVRLNNLRIRDPGAHKRSWRYFILLLLICLWGWISQISLVSKDRDFYVGPVLPSAATVKNLLEGERQKIMEAGDISPYTNYQLLANTYALTYAFIREFELREIPIFVFAGSLIGAVRHHGIIPFSEKDVDFAVFSTDSKRVGDAIQAALNSQGYGALTFEESNFGFQFEERRHGDASLRNKSNISHYFDFWFWESYADGTGKKQAKCVGRDKTGCDKFYNYFYPKNAPVFEYSDWFPPRYQVFGTHRVPVPSTNKQIEMFPFEDGKDFWNTTCGPSRRWVPESQKFVPESPQDRICSNFYDNNPFVFLKDDGTEQLQQGSTVLHEAPRASHKK